ncbi:MAG: hypothetical protein M5U28_18880 [Sandaracinaceae bacterium]|nr:hypothetical protein [Sandaracinaceae bacterium]
MRVVLGLALLTAACVEPAPPARPPTECARLGERCQLPDGPIGICSETSEPCDHPPCLACVSQH